MRNMKVMIIIKSIYWCAVQQIKDKLQARTGERTWINVEEVNKKKKDEEKYTKNVITK
jgi:hypothetical protein